MKHRRHVFLGVSAAVAVAVMAVAHEVMLPFVLAIVIAYVLTPLVAMAERRKLPPALAVILVYAVVLGGAAGFVRAVSPRIALEFRNLRGELPGLAAEAKTKWVPAIGERMRDMGLAPPEPVKDESAEPAPTSAFVARPQPDGSIAIDVGTGAVVVETKSGGWAIEPRPEHHGEPFDPNRVIADVVGKSFAYAQENSLEIARAVRNLVAGISRVVFVFFITLMLAAYIMLTSARGSFDELLRRIDKGLSGVVRGQLVICGINGVLSAIGFAIVGLKYWPVMALVAAVFSAIPIFGSIASAVPAVAVGLTQGLGTATFVLLWIVGIHQLEANLLNPKIMGDAAKIHPVLIIFSLLVGEHFFRVPGALLAVPTMSIAQSLFLHLNDVTQKGSQGGEERRSSA